MRIVRASKKVLSLQAIVEGMTDMHSEKRLSNAERWKQLSYTDRYKLLSEIVSDEDVLLMSQWEWSELPLH